MPQVISTNTTVFEFSLKELEKLLIDKVSCPGQQARVEFIHEDVSRDEDRYPVNKVTGAKVIITSQNFSA